MLTEIVTLELTPAERPGALDELYGQAWELIAANLAKLAKDRGSKAVLEGYLDDARADGAALCSEQPLALRFLFASPGGGTNVTARVCRHWFELIRVHAHAELAAICKHAGYLLARPKTTAKELASAPRALSFLTVGDELVGVTRGEAPRIHSDELGEVSLDEAQLPAAKERAARALAKSGICECAVCKSIRRGATAVVPEKAARAKGTRTRRESFDSLAKAMRASERVEAVSAWGKGIERLPDDIGRLVHLVTLRVPENRICVVPPSLFRIPALEVVDLRQNPLKGLPLEVGQAKRLRSLSLERTQISALPETLGDLPMLESLSLSHCPRLAAVPAALTRLSNLRSLELEGCSALKEPLPNLGLISTLERLNLANIAHPLLADIDLAKLGALRELDLRRAGFLAIPEGIGALSQLVKLDVSFNPITDLPPSFAGLLRLEQLAIAWSKLTTLPAVLARLPALHTLELLRSQELVSLAGIGGCGALKDLSLLYCEKLDELPAELCAVTTLETLRLGGTGIRKLPMGLGRMPALRNVYMSAGRLVAGEADRFRSEAKAAVLHEQ